MAARKLLLSLLLSACCAAAGAAAPAMIALASATYDSGSGSDVGSAVAVNSQGEIYAVDTNNANFILLKYSKALNRGTPQVFTTGGSDAATGIAVDGLGNIVVSGFGATSRSDTDYVALKYSANFSAFLASATYDSGLNHYDKAYGVVTDGNNNIFVTGYRENGIDKDFYTIKYSPGFVQLSSAAYDGNYNDLASGLALSGSNLVVTGMSGNSSGNKDVRVVIYDENLHELNNTFFNGGGDEAGVGAAVDSRGDIIIAASRLAATQDFLTLKYDAFLNLLSSAVYDSGNADVPSGVAVDSQDNIIVTGFRNNGSNTDFFTIKYDRYLNVVSTAAYDGGSYDLANAVAVDPDDNVIVVGQTLNSDNDLFLVRYNASPRITAVDPLYIGETYNVKIAGKGLLADTAVSFADPLISTGGAVYNSGEITLSVKPSTAVYLGVTTITVTNSNGETSSDYTLARTRMRTTIPAGASAHIAPMTRLGQISVTVPSGAFAQQQTMTLYPLPAEAGDIQQVGEALYISASTNSLLNMTVTLRYAVSDLGGDPESSLSLAYYSAPGGWVPVPSSVNTSDKSVTGAAKAAGTKYAVIKSVSTGGGGEGGGAGGSGIPAKIYPNPYRPGSGGRFDNSSIGQGIVFAGLGANRTVNLTIVDLAGRLVYQKSAAADADGRYLWDTKTVSGGEAATGVYLYLITGGSAPMKGKFAIIR